MRRPSLYVFGQHQQTTCVKAGATMSGSLDFLETDAAPPAVAAGGGGGGGGEGGKGERRGKKKLWFSYMGQLLSEIHISFY